MVLGGLSFCGPWPHLRTDFLSAPTLLHTLSPLFSWTHQVHIQLWALTGLFPHSVPFLFSHLTIADSSSFMSQHKYYFPRKMNTATLPEIPPHPIHLCHVIVIFFIAFDVTWHFPVYIYWFIFPPLPHMTQPLEEQRIGPSYWLLYPKCLEQCLIKYYWIQVNAITRVKLSTFRLSVHSCFSCSNHSTHAHGYLRRV